MNHIIIDTDAGVDDAIALMLALDDPNTRVEAITTVAGNVAVDKVTQNVGLVLDRMGVDVPILRGCAGPLIGEGIHAAGVHGEDGLGNTNLPPSARAVQSEHAALAMARLARERPGELSLVALAPLTNVALAMRLDASFAANLKSIMVMGGAVQAQGNSSPVAEFNVLADPEAAKIVLGAGVADLSLLSWETTVKYPVLWADVERLRGIGTARAEFFSRITAYLQDLLRSRFHFPGLLIPDPLAMMAALWPDIVRDAAKFFVDVEIHGELARGLTAVDYRGLSGKTPNVRIIQDMDYARIVRLLDEMLRG